MDTVDTEDSTTLITEKEGEEVEAGNTKKTLGAALIICGASIVILTVIIWLSTYVHWTQYAAPVFWIILGIFIFFHGIIIFFNPPETYRLDVEVNGRHSTSNIFLRKSLIYAINIVCSIIGIMTMIFLFPSTWKIVGLVCSILLLLLTFFDVLYCHLRTRNIINIKCPNNSGLNLETYLASTGEILAKQVYTVLQIIPLPNLASLKDLGMKMTDKKNIVSKPAHVLFITMAMCTCLVMFSAQLYDHATTEDDNHNDPDGTFAKSYLSYPILAYSPFARKVIILISTPITFLLGAVLLALLRGITTLRMILSVFISLGMGIFFCLFSVDTVQLTILLGSNMSSLAYILKFVTMMPVPLLAATFIALAYSNFTQIQEETQENSSSKHKTCVTPMLIILALGLIVLSLVVMVSSNIIIMSTVQGHWNSTRDHSWDKECRDDDRNDYGYYDYYRHENTLKHNSTKSKPDKCFTKALDGPVQDDFTFFSISQIMLTESMLFLSIFIITTGKKISLKSLCLPGFLLFDAASVTIISFFFAIFKYDLLTHGMPFFILNGTSSLVSVILGFSLFCAGISFLISFVALLFRIILFIAALCLIMVLVSFQLLFKLAMELSKVSKFKDVNNEKVVIQPEC